MPKRVNESVLQKCFVETYVVKRQKVVFRKVQLFFDAYIQLCSGISKGYERERTFNAMTREKPKIP